MLGGSEKVRLTWEQKRRQFRIIYETLYDTPRSKVSDIATVLNVTRKTARGRMKEAFDMG
jgi:predicted transcriptional regulator